MAPEQVEGRETDDRTDIFAFGAMTYEMITGRPAFEERGQRGLVASILNGASPAVSPAEAQKASALDSFIARCLAGHPSERWQSMSDVLRMLRQIEQLNAR